MIILDPLAILLTASVKVGTVSQPKWWQGHIRSIDMVRVRMISPERDEPIRCVLVHTSIAKITKNFVRVVPFRVNLLRLISPAEYSSFRWILRDSWNILHCCSTSWKFSFSEQKVLWPKISLKRWRKTEVFPRTQIRSYYRRTQVDTQTNKRARCRCWCHRWRI